MTKEDEGRSAPDLLTQVSEVGLAQRLRLAVHEFEMAVDVACYHDGAHGTRELRERTREMVRNLIDDVDRALGGLS